MYSPLQYQVSEYDCVPAAFINAVSYLFERNEIPPMVIRHIYLYCLDTVGREARLGLSGTSKYAVRLLGNWLNSYKIKKFSVTTEFLEGKEVNLKQGNKIIPCLDEGGVALCNIILGSRQEHYLLMIRAEEGWLYFFDPYRRKRLRGLRNRVSLMDSMDSRSPNLKIRIEWMEQDDDKTRFCLGPTEMRECLLMWRIR